MPANLPPQYYEAEKVYRTARTAQEKIEALENMLAIMPHHKGTDKLRADLRSKIAKLTTESERRQGGARAQLFNVRKEGAGQIALVGLANSGKSQLVAGLTDATPKVADYPFTTQLPFPAMMPFENVKIQLVDLPAATEHVSHPWIRSVFRAADMLFLVVDLSFDPLSEFEQLLEELAAMHLEPIWDGDLGLEEDMVTVRKRALVVANKLDAPGSEDTLELLRLEVGDRLPILPVSAAEGTGLDELRRATFEALGIVRVYTRAPGQKVDFSSPFVLKRGSTIDDAAEQVHKDLRETLKYAVVWGSGKFDGQRVGRTYVVEDGDVVEFIAARRG